MRAHSKKDLYRINDEEQYKFADIFQKSARSGAAYWYGEKWKSVDKCVLCDLRQRYVIKEKENVVLTTNIYPYIDGHLMILPRRHVASLKELTDKEWETIRALFYVARKMLKKTIGVKGLWMLYREGGGFESSEKTVEHLHIHLMPFKDNLVEWNYQKINIGPFDVANIFKRNGKMFEAYYKRYFTKYSDDDKKSDVA